MANKHTLGPGAVTCVMCGTARAVDLDALPDDERFRLLAWARNEEAKMTAGAKAYDEAAAVRAAGNSGDTLIDFVNAEANAALVAQRTSASVSNSDELIAIVNQAARGEGG